MRHLVGDGYLQVPPSTRGVDRLVGVGKMLIGDRHDRYREWTLNSFSVTIPHPDKSKARKGMNAAMKIIGFSASARKNKSTHFLLGQCLDAVKLIPDAAGKPIETELIDLAPMTINGCIACDACKKKGVMCSQRDDFQTLIPKLADPDLAGIILATPVYMGSMTSQAKAFWDRTVLFRRNGFMLKNRLGGAIAVGGSRNGGQELTVQGVHAAMMIHGMIIVGDGEHFGGAAWSNHPDGYQGDDTGIGSARNLGRGMAEIARMMQP